MLLSITFRHNVRSSFGKRGDDCSTASRGEVENSTGPNLAKHQYPKESTSVGPQMWPMGLAGSVSPG